VKDGIKLFSELKAKEFLSYISDKIFCKVACLPESFENFINSNPTLQEKVTNIIQLRDESASILFEVA